MTTQTQPSSGGVITPDLPVFLQRCREGNLIPVWRELVADQETPLSVYSRVRNSPSEDRIDNSFLLESVEGGEYLARYSFIGLHPRVLFRGIEDTVEIIRPGVPVEVRTGVEPLSVIEESMAGYRPVADPELPRFFGGAVGYLGFDGVAQFEKVPLSEKEGLGWADSVFGIMDTVIVFDHVRHTMKVVANAYVEEGSNEQEATKAYEDALQQIESVCHRLSGPVPYGLLDARSPVEELAFCSNTNRDDFQGMVETAKEYIRAGDVIQVVLSQRFETDYEGDPLDVYRSLRVINPSPYMFCLQFGDQSLVGASPEIHVRCEDGRVDVRPIAGTRPRSDDPVEDLRLADELLEDPKERAEHIMLVDLARNDSGRVCTYGTVHVPELMVIERYSHVMHIVSDVIGELSPERNVYDVMRATFPAGTVSGAPKVRAMEIIAELEQARRGAYAGAVGYFSYDGNLDSCIAIRTVQLDGKKAYVQAGAGIVADSDPDKEFEETRNKARGMLKAIAQAKTYTDVRTGGAS